MDIRSAVKILKGILSTTPEKAPELKSLVSRLYFTYKDTNYRDFVLSLIHFVSSSPELFEQNYLFACLTRRKHTDVPKELSEYLIKNMPPTTSSTVITSPQPSIHTQPQTPIQATYKNTLLIEPSTPAEIPLNTCVIFIRQEDPEFFKNSPYIIEQASKLPVYRLDASLFPESNIPIFDFTTTTFTNALLWTDRYYINIRKQFITPVPFIKDDIVIGPLNVDVSLFREHYDKIMTYDDIAYGYIKETDTKLPDTSNVFTVNRKVCCSTAREMYSNTIIYIPDQGKEFLYSIDWLNDQIQGDKGHE